MKEWGIKYKTLKINNFFLNSKKSQWPINYNKIVRLNYSSQQGVNFHGDENQFNKCRWGGQGPFFLLMLSVICPQKPCVRRVNDSTSQITFIINSREHLTTHWQLDSYCQCRKSIIKALLYRKYHILMESLSNTFEQIQRFINNYLLDLILLQLWEVKGQQMDRKHLDFLKQVLYLR